MEHSNRGRKSSNGGTSYTPWSLRLNSGREVRNVNRAPKFQDEVSFGPDSEPPQPNLKPTFGTKFKGYFKRHKWIKRGGLAAALAALLIAVIVVRFYTISHKVFVAGDKAVALNQDVDPNLLKGEGDGRVNILLMGVGGPNHPGGELSDTIMMVSLDPVSHDVTLFSIPRDLYVPIPGFGSAKINAASAYGEQNHYPGGGPKLLEQTIEQNLGVPIHYFVRVDFDAFKEAIDTVGGVDITVPKALYDPYFPDAQLKGYEPLYIPAGHQHMNGDTALRYARSRETTSDFDRAARQQLLLVSLKAKLLTIGTLANPIKINKLLSTVGSHVLTDLSVNDMLKLYDIAKQVQTNQITRAALTNDPKNYLASELINGQSSLVPKTGNFTAIKRYVRSLMPDGYIKREAATITLLNGTDRPGLGKQTAAILRSYGYKVIGIRNADNQTHTKTLIYDHTSGLKPYTLHYLSRRFSTSPLAQGPTDPATDITIILGSDYTPVD